jgi:hypothetical protein
MDVARTVRWSVNSWPHSLASSMSVARFNTIVLVLCVVYPAPVMSTSVVIFVANNGVVISTDSKTALKNGDFSVSVGEKEQPKSVILQGRLVVTAIGISDFGNEPNHYNFFTWIHSLQMKLGDNISVDDLAAMIARESSSTFSRLNVDAALKSGALRQKAPAEPCSVFAQFVIAGYQDGLPRIYKVQFDIDWNNKGLVGPTSVLLYPDPSETTNYRMFRFGTQQALVDFFDRRSYAYQKAMALYPKAMTDVAIGKYPSLDETVSLSRAAIQIEENTNPSDVGGEIRTIEILPDGRAKEVALRKTVLPKAKATAKQE